MEYFRLYFTQQLFLGSIHDWLQQNSINIMWTICPSDYWWDKLPALKPWYFLQTSILSPNNCNTPTHPLSVSPKSEPHSFRASPTLPPYLLKPPHPTHSSLPTPKHTTHTHTHTLLHSSSRSDHPINAMLTTTESLSAVSQRSATLSNNCFQGLLDNCGPIRALHSSKWGYVAW